MARLSVLFFAIASAAVLIVGISPRPFSAQQQTIPTSRKPACGCYVCGKLLAVTFPDKEKDCAGILASDACTTELANMPPARRQSFCQKLKSDLKFSSFKTSCPDFARVCDEPKPEPEKCDEEKACEIVRAMLDLIARYSAPGGFDPGSFSRFMSEFNPLLQKLSEALACRFNEEGDQPANAAILKELLGKILRDRNYFQTVNDRSEFPKISACIDRIDGQPIRQSLAAACADYDRVQRIRQNLEQLAGALSCPAAPTPAAKEECKELSNSLLDGLSTLFEQLDKLSPTSKLGSGDAYDQVAGGLEGAIKELESTAETIEGQGRTGAQQYKDIQGRIAKLKELLDVWNRMKAASCLPTDVMQLLRRLAMEKKSGTEHKATCTELCAATADWYVKMSGLAAQRGTFFKACSLACF